MTQRNNNISVLPFYTSRQQQYHRKFNAFGAFYPLNVPQDKLIPFQFAIPHNGSAWTGGAITTNSIEITDFAALFHNFIMPDAGSTSEIARDSRLIGPYGYTIEFDQAYMRNESGTMLIGSTSSIKILNTLTGSYYTGTIAYVAADNSTGNINMHYDNTYQLPYDTKAVIIPTTSLAYKPLTAAARSLCAFDFKNNISNIKPLITPGTAITNSTVYVRGASITFSKAPVTFSSADNYLYVQEGSVLTISAPLGCTIGNISFYGASEKKNMTGLVPIDVSTAYTTWANGVMKVYLKEPVSSISFRLDGFDETIAISKIYVEYAEVAAPDAIILFDENDNAVGDITNDMYAAGLTILPNAEHDFDSVIYTAARPFFVNGKPLEPGRYYIEMTFGDDEYTSEVFTVSEFTDNCIKLTWSDWQDLWIGDAYKYVYKLDEDNTFENVLYICSSIDRPEYSFEEEGEERDGVFFAEKQLSEKVFKFVFIAPEYICDAIRLLPMSDEVHIEYNGKDFEADRLSVEIAWQEQGDLAAVSVEFRTGNVIKKIANKWPK